MEAASLMDGVNGLGLAAKWCISKSELEPKTGCYCSDVRRTVGHNHSPKKKCGYKSVHRKLCGLVINLI